MTIYNTPIIRHFLGLIGWCILKIFGWRAVWELPTSAHKYIIIVYPHTSNWDFPLGMASTFACGVSLQWMGKDNLFRGLAGPVMRWLGGIAIDRSQANDVVASTIQAFNERDEMILTVPPEGTRGYRDHWKSGFYHMALGADVPIAFGFIDYGAKEVGVRGLYQLTGDKKVDLAKIQEFYSDKKALNVEDAAPIVFRNMD